MMRLTFVALAIVGLTACSLQPCPQIDWIDFVQVGQTQFVAGTGNPPAIQESDLGPVILKVKFKVEGNVCDPHYKTKDGDAAFLDVGTPVYQVNGHPPSELVAARRDGSIVAFQAFKPAE